jgi:hypothetical protein
MRWERFGNDWIERRFVSEMHTIFIIETVLKGSVEEFGGSKSGTHLYCFDDGPEIPTEGIFLEPESARIMRKDVDELEKSDAGEQAICEYLFGYFPELRKHWLGEYGKL